MSDIYQNFQQRRDKLASMLAANSVAIVPAATHKLRNKDTEYKFRQYSDYYYLTGIQEADGVLILETDEHQQLSSHIFLLAKDPKQEQWVGNRIGCTAAIDIYLLDNAYILEDLEEKILEILLNKQHLYFSITEDNKFDQKVLTWLGQAKRHLDKIARSQGDKAKRIPETIHDLRSVLHNMRVIKDQAEIELMRKAASVSASAHLAIMHSVKPNVHEFEMEALFRNHCMLAGSLSQAYEPIVAGGDNACILHYMDNNQQLHEGDLLLVDAGCEWQMYAADITRTIPVNGKFSQEQAAIYNLVLESQLAAINILKPGLQWTQIQDTILQVIVKGLVELEILDNSDRSIEELIKQKAFAPFYMHSSGHWLGLDTHDVGRYRVDGASIALKPGMVLTVEPGIYIANNIGQHYPELNLDPKWLGIGVRIEDDILITDTGCEVLSSGVPKSIQEIEAIMRNSNHIN